MVASVKLPEDDPLAVLNSIIQERRQYAPLQSFYDKIKPHMVSQFLFYLKYEGNPEVIRPLSLLNFTNGKDEALQRKQTLINLYSPKEHQTPYEILKKMRRQHGLLCCPSCGEDGAPGTLDHYLPKDEFPELSVCLANLTPMCNRCQEEKSTSYLTESGKKAYIHPYFDNLDESFFHVEVYPPYDAPSRFELRIVRGEPKILRLLISHVQGVKFQERFKEFCEAKHIHLLKLMAKRRLETTPKSVEELINIFLMPEIEKSLNCWPVIYYKSVLRNTELLAYLDSGKLPDYI